MELDDINNHECKMGCNSSLILAEPETKCENGNVSTASNADSIESKTTNALTPRLIDVAWKIANEQAAKVKSNQRPIVVKRSTWKTIRIFVSSTFKDFDSEREILVKKVFPDLRIWCQTRKLHLVECDLRWGIPLNSTAEAPLRTCLGEIDRCISENVVPFFINMVSERIGWIPIGDQLPDWIKRDYKWIEGMSITEMEIMHAAYRSDNPNAIFLVRDRKFLESVPPELQKQFLDENPLAPYKISLLKQMLERRFSKSDNLVYYKCHFDGVDPATKWPRLGGLDDFAAAVFKFFQDRIMLQYPLVESNKMDPLEETRQQHENFMKFQSEMIVGRDQLVTDILKKYVSTETNVKPALVSGSPGLGKSSIMCALASTCSLKDAKNRKIFYHFCGAVQGSTDLLAMLNRLLVEIGIIAKPADGSKKPKLITDLEEAMGLVRGALSKDSTPRCVLIIDAINQFDDVRSQVAPICWLPTKLGKNVRLIISAIPESIQHQRIQRDLGSSWDIVQLQPLDRQTKEHVVSSHLSRYNKILDAAQMDLLLNKKASDNPLWLTLAAEELRVFGHVRQLTGKISSMPDGLFELEEDILSRFERESDAALLIATVCLFECSAAGLLESEVVELLASPDLIPPQLRDLVLSKSNVTMEMPLYVINERETSTHRKITANKWADVFRFLKPLLRPFGSSGEGLLHFYHRSLSKTTRKRYFSEEFSFETDGRYVGEIQKFYCRKLASYFSKTDPNIERRLQEYPLAAFYCGDFDGLIAFLSDTTVFDAMYDEEFSPQLSHSWALVHEMAERTKSPEQRSDNLYDVMETCYLDMAENMIAGKLPPGNCSLAERLERFARVLMQNRCCVAGAKVAECLVKMTLDEGFSDLPSAQLDHAKHLYLKAIIVDEDLRVHDYFLRTHLPNYDPKAALPRLMNLVDCYQSAIAIFKEHSPTDQRLGRCYNGVSFHYAGISMRGGIGDLTAESAKRLAIQHIEDAISLYSDYHSDNNLLLADCFITRGICEIEPTPQQLEFYVNAQSIIIDRYGPFHVLLLRAYFNIGIYYQELGDGDASYTHFQKWYQLLFDIFGGHHPRTMRAAKFLADGNFRRIAMERGHHLLTSPPTILTKKNSDLDGIDQPISTSQIELS